MGITGILSLNWLCFKFADQGLANLLGLETLRHGTNLINYIGIKILGGLPSHGLKATGSTYGYALDNTANKFYVFKDHHFKDTVVGRSNINKFISIPWIGKRVLPNQHKFFACCGLSRELLDRVIGNTDNIFALALPQIFVSFPAMIINALITPTLKFRVTPEEVARNFIDDPQYSGLAYYTTHRLGINKIGFIGTLIQGLNNGIVERARTNPGKTFTGLIQLASAVGLGVLGYTIFPGALPIAAPATLALMILN